MRIRGSNISNMLKAQVEVQFAPGDEDEQPAAEGVKRSLLRELDEVQLTGVFASLPDMPPVSYNPYAQAYDFDSIAIPRTAPTGRF